MIDFVHSIVIFLLVSFQDGWLAIHAVETLSNSSRILLLQVVILPIHLYSLTARLLLSLDPYPSFSMFAENDGSQATCLFALEESGCCIGGVDFLTLVCTSFGILIQLL